MVEFFAEKDVGKRRGEVVHILIKSVSKSEMGERKRKVVHWLVEIVT